MTSAVVRETVRDVPHLSVAVNHHTSSSPFPSPGSPFFPPPKLNAHEFAAKPIEQIMRAIETKRKSTDPTGSAAQNRDGESTPTISLPGGGGSPPVTPTPQSFQTQPPPPKVIIPDPPATPSEKHPPHRESLTSSRPAPPSPAASRRTSAALSRHSSYARSRPTSRITSLSQSLLPTEEVQQQGDHQAEGSSSTVVPSPKRRSLLMKIRDFAFPSSDDRHTGKGTDVPRPNRPRHRSSTYSSSSSTHEDEVANVEEEQRHGSWSSFRWNTLSQHFWGDKRAQEQSDGKAGPSKTEFDINFDMSSPAEEISEPEYGDDDDDDDNEGQDEEGFLEGGDDEALIPGTYRALYAFEPEGTAEMALEEEQIVHVIGRGGGVGWAIVEKEGGGHALVPESYLDLVQADEDPDDPDA